MYCGLYLGEQSSCWTFNLYRDLILAYGQNIFAFFQALRVTRLISRKNSGVFLGVKSKGVFLFLSLCNLPHLPGAAGGEAETFLQGPSPLCGGCNNT